MNWTLFMLFVLLCVPGFLIAVPRLTALMRPQMEKNLKPGQSLPSAQTLILAQIAQGLVLTAIAAVVGLLLASRVGLSAPFFEAVAAGDWGAAREAFFGAGPSAWSASRGAERASPRCQSCVSSRVRGASSQVKFYSRA